MWGAREDLRDTAVTSSNRFSEFTDRVKDSIGQYEYDNRHRSIIWDERLEKEIETLEHNLDHQCLQWFRLTWEERVYHSDIDEETEGLIKPKYDEVDAKFVEYKEKTVEGLKRKRREGYSGGWDLTDWHEEYERYKDDLFDYVATMNDDVNDESDSE